MLYPSGWRVELNPSSRSTEGDVVFHSPGKDKVYVSWGPLEKARNRFADTEQHAESSIDRIRRSRDVRNLEVEETRTLPLNGHQVVFHRIKFEVYSPGILMKGKTEYKSVYSAHIHCPESGRYLVLYTLCDQESSVVSPQLVQTLINSISCHHTTKNIEF